MSNTGHAEGPRSPLPWKYEDGELLADDGAQVVTPVYCYAEDMYYIVKCVNLHDDLVDAVKAANAVLHGIGFEDKRAIRQTLKAVLDKAKGE